jgi:hypothetical protein
MALILPRSRSVWVRSPTRLCVRTSCPRTRQEVVGVGYVFAATAGAPPDENASEGNGQSFGQEA